MSRLRRLRCCRATTLGRIVALACLVGGLAACGYKGALVLPDAPPSEPNPPANTAPATAS